MRSMTGFGSGRAVFPGGSVQAHIASVNHRGCQVQLRAERLDLAGEDAIRTRVRTAVVRGAITVQITVSSEQTLPMDTARLAPAWRELAAVAHDLGAPVPTVEAVAALLPRAARDDGDALTAAAVSAVETAIAGVLATRAREGAALAAEFIRQQEMLVALVARLRTTAAARLPSWREALRARLEDVLKSQSVPADVLVRELAIYAERVDVAEELVRLDAHLVALAALITGHDEQAGRKLEFLLQEIGREVNTTGAKSSDTALTALVLDAKHIVEQLKEQAANVA